MTYSPHERYLQQAAWTRELRQYIFKEIGLDKTTRALEVGCGTGAILMEMDTPAYGLDIRLATVKKAKIHTQNIHRLSCADAASLPHPDESFEVVFCHFLLLWLPNPQTALAEMMRVTRPHGHIIAFAEPDYTRRVDKPAALKQLGAWQRDALQAQGADPGIGARLATLFYETGIRIFETGAISNSTDEAFYPAEWALEWEVIEADLRGRVPEVEIQKMKMLDKEAWQKGGRVLYVPTHYVWGKKSG